MEVTQRFLQGTKFSFQSLLVNHWLPLTTAAAASPFKISDILFSTIIMSDQTNNTSCAYSVLFFARAREIVGKNKLSFSLSSATILLSDLLCTVFTQYPDLKELQDSMLIAVNGDYVSPKDNQLAIKPSDEIAFIPPISGG
jgi:molybdopterin converting factor small subunit